MSNLNLQDILDMFQNGERRYAEDPAFKAAVDSLKMGLGVYAVLDHTLKENDALRLKLAVVTSKLAPLTEELRRETAQKEGAFRRNEEMRNVLRGKEAQLYEYEKTNCALVSELQAGQVLMTEEVYPGELKSLRAEVETLKLEKRELAEHADRLKDEVASYKDALDLHRETRGDQFR